MCCACLVCAACCEVFAACRLVLFPFVWFCVLVFAVCSLRVALCCALQAVCCMFRQPLYTHATCSIPTSLCLRRVCAMLLRESPSHSAPRCTRCTRASTHSFLLSPRPPVAAALVAASSALTSSVPVTFAYCSNAACTTFAGSAANPSSGIYTRANAYGVKVTTSGGAAKVLSAVSLRTCYTMPAVGLRMRYSISVVFLRMCYAMSAVCVDVCYATSREVRIRGLVWSGVKSAGCRCAWYRCLSRFAGLIWRMPMREVLGIAVQRERMVLTARYSASIWCCWLRVAASQDRVVLRERMVLLNPWYCERVCFGTTGLRCGGSRSCSRPRKSTRASGERSRSSLVLPCALKTKPDSMTPEQFAQEMSRQACGQSFSPCVLVFSASSVRGLISLGVL